MPCDKIDCQLKIECFDAYGKFKYPPCASESVDPNPYSLLKAEILQLAESIRICIKERKYQYALNRVDDIVAKLSAV